MNHQLSAHPDGPMDGALEKLLPSAPEPQARAVALWESV